RKPSCFSLKEIMAKGAKGLSDPRFIHLKSDPKFGGFKRKERKVVLESRFAGALTDARFTRAPNVDKRGRKVKRSGDATLHHLYEIEETNTNDDEVAKKESECYGEEGEEEANNDAERLRYDLARGDGAYISSSSEEEEDEVEEWELEKEDVDHDWGTLDKDAYRVEWASRRLAICNLDWDSLSSEDLFFLVSSFKPLGGRVESLTIYLSNMGKEKLEKEENQGPELLLDDNDAVDSDEHGELDEEALKHDNKKREAIRKYQMERLKYYYAILVCDSEQTASAIYENCDGVEYENSGLRVDLRFVPDHMTFDEDRVKERVTGEDVDNSKYKPRELSNIAAATTKVKLTWEECDINREKKLKEAFDDDADLEAMSTDLIAPSSGEDEDSDDGRRRSHLSTKARLSLLLGGIEKGDEELEIEWDNEEEDIEKEKKIKKSKSSWEEYLEKRKAKRKDRKAAAKEERRKAKEERHNEIRPDKRKAIREKDHKNVKIDPRFNALFTDSAYSIDATSNLNKNNDLVEEQNSARRKRKAKSEEERKSEGSQHSLVDKLKKKSAKWTS
ncbi:hypothetical protein PFISCL1PPCAC_15495, partial [Pristionchus fissidentatus]